MDGPGAGTRRWRAVQAEGTHLCSWSCASHILFIEARCPFRWHLLRLGHPDQEKLPCQWFLDGSRSFCDLPSPHQEPLRHNELSFICSPSSKTLERMWGYCEVPTPRLEGPKVGKESKTLRCSDNGGGGGGVCVYVGLPP